MVSTPVLAPRQGLPGCPDSLAEPLVLDIRSEQHADIASGAAAPHQGPFGGVMWSFGSVSRALSMWDVPPSPTPHSRHAHHRSLPRLVSPPSLLRPPLPLARCHVCRWLAFTPAAMFAGGWQPTWVMLRTRVLLSPPPPPKASFGLQPISPCERSTFTCARQLDMVGHHHRHAAAQACATYTPRST